MSDRRQPDDPGESSDLEGLTHQLFDPAPDAHVIIRDEAPFASYPGVTLLEKPFTAEKLLAVVRDLRDA